MYRLEMVVMETYGEEQESILQTARLWQQNVSVIIGPVETCVHEVRKYQNILVLVIVQMIVSNYQVYEVMALY